MRLVGQAYPNLLRSLTVDRRDLGCLIHITYIPPANVSIYIVAVMDCFSRRTLSWRLSITMDTHFCVEALKEAIEYYGCPELFNTD